MANRCENTNVVDCPHCALEIGALAGQLAGRLQARHPLKLWFGEEFSVTLFVTPECANHFMYGYWTELHGIIDKRVLEN